MDYVHVITVAVVLTVGFALLLIYTIYRHRPVTILPRIHRSVPTPMDRARALGTSSVTEAPSGSVAWVGSEIVAIESERSVNGYPLGTDGLWRADSGGIAVATREVSDPEVAAVAVLNGSGLVAASAVGAWTGREIVCLRGGMVFLAQVGRVTALEVQGRTLVRKAVMDPNWPRVFHMDVQAADGVLVCWMGSSHPKQIVRYKWAVHDFIELDRRDAEGDERSHLACGASWFAADTVEGLLTDHPHFEEDEEGRHRVWAWGDVLLYDSCAMVDDDGEPEEIVSLGAALVTRTSAGKLAVHWPPE